MKLSWLPIVQHCVANFFLQDPLVLQTLLWSYTLCYVNAESAFDEVVAFRGKLLEICVNIF